MTAYAHDPQHPQAPEAVGDNPEARRHNAVRRLVEAARSLLTYVAKDEVGTDYDMCEREDAETDLLDALTAYDACQPKSMLELAQARMNAKPDEHLKTEGA